MPNDPIPPLKRQLANEIVAIASTMDFFIAARMLDIDPSRLSDLRHGRVARFSLDRLVRLLAMVERRVELTVVTQHRPERRWFKVLRERANRRD